MRAGLLAVGLLAIGAWPIMAQAREPVRLEQQGLKLEMAPLDAINGSVYYPPNNLSARWLSPYDERLSQLSALGAGFIALTARKPMHPPGDHR